MKLAGSGFSKQASRRTQIDSGERPGEGSQQGDDLIFRAAEGGRENVVNRLNTSHWLTGNFYQRRYFIKGTY